MQNILFEDKQLIALNKPCGVVVESDTTATNTLQAEALAYIRSNEKYPDKCFIGAPHRLDKPVSGVVLFAKKKSILKQLSETFATRDIQKTYFAIVETAPDKTSAELVHWLVKDSANRKALIYATEVKNSTRVRLNYQVLVQNTFGTLLQIKLITGKYHQIRAQLAHIGCPIIGDTQYGSKKQYLPDAIGLFARELSLHHPLTKEPLKITAPLPDDIFWNAFDLNTATEITK